MQNCLIVILVTVSIVLACERSKKEFKPTQQTEEIGKSTQKICDDAYQENQIIKVSDNIYVAHGFDLANTILIKTPKGNVIVDAGLSPVKASVTRKKLLEGHPGKIHSLIYTHSHIDHVGGASVWMEEGTDIWAHASFRKNFLKQYGLFQPVESIRGRRQYGANIPDSVLPCTSIGPRPDLNSVMQSGARLPTRTFADHETLDFDGFRIELFYVPGETKDQIMVWVPSEKALMVGDNFYKAFPNLYTIRGTTARPVADWIASIDKMRSLEPEVLIPSHTGIISGKDEINKKLTVFRDGIQWIYDGTVREANKGKPVEEIVDTVKLPPHLATEAYLQPLYGEIHWSVESIYNNNLGWFSGPADQLYKPETRQMEQKEIEMMGGTASVIAEAKKLQDAKENKLAMHLLAKLHRNPALLSDDQKTDVRKHLQTVYQNLAAKEPNTNGKAYLLQSAYELEHGVAAVGRPSPEEATMNDFPMSIFLRGLTVRLIPEKAEGVLRSVAFKFKDEKSIYYITVRNGIAELSENVRLPGTPDPDVTLTMDSMVWRKISLKKTSFPAAYASGDIEMDGSMVSFLSFFRMFDRS